VTHLHFEVVFNVYYIFHRKRNLDLMAIDEAAAAVSEVVVEVPVVNEEKGVEVALAAIEDLEVAKGEEVVAVQEQEANGTLIVNLEMTERKLFRLFFKVTMLAFYDEPQIGTNETNDLKLSELSL